MKLSIGVTIFIICILATAGELILFLLSGFGSTFTQNFGEISGIAKFFIYLMAITATIGILTLVSALIEAIVRIKKISFVILVPSLIAACYYMYNIDQKMVAKANTMIKNLSTMNMNGVTAKVDSVRLEMTPDEKAYVPKIKILNLRAQQSRYDEPSVYGEIRNTGKQALAKVEIKINFLNAAGHPIASDTYSPVAATSVVGQPDPALMLKPGATRKFGFKPMHVSAEWSKKISAEIVNIVLSK